MNTNLLSYFYKYLWSERKSVQSLLICALVGNIFLFAIPFLIQALVQQYSMLIFQQTTLFIIIMVAGFLTGLGFLKALQLNLAERLKRRIFVNGIYRGFDSLEKKAGFTPANIARLNPIFESVLLKKSIVPLLLDGFTLCVQAILTLIFISFYHPLFLLYSVALATALYFIIIVIGRRTLRLALEESNQKYHVISTLQRKLDAPLSADELDDSVAKYLTVREDRYSYYFKQSVGILVVQIIASVLLISVGGLLVTNNKMTLGQLVASELILTNLLISLFKFTHLLDYWYDSLVGLYKLSKYFPVDESSKELS